MKTALIAAAIALILGLGVIGAITYVLVVPPSSAAPPGPIDVDVEVTGGEFDSSFGFGAPGTDIGSPGPEIKVEQGNNVRVTFTNAGAIPHSFRVVKERKWDAPAVFGAFIGSPTNPVGSGLSGTTTFKADKAGSYFYICTVPGHVERGMFGTLLVEP